MPTSREYARQRNRMVDEQLVKRGINDRRVLDAMRVMPRHQFVLEEFKAHAYEDRPLPIGEGQTISQPYIVAFMTERLRLKPHQTVLEIGTGSGYQTAILCHLTHYVFSVERVGRLADQAGERIGDLGYNNLDIYVGDGSPGLARPSHLRPHHGHGGRAAPAQCALQPIADTRRPDDPAYRRRALARTQADHPPRRALHLAHACCAADSSR